MSIKDEAKNIALAYQCIKQTLETNHVLLDIYEGNLLPYLHMDLQNQLSPEAVESCINRVPPINLMKRVIDKLSTIYAREPEREVIGSENDGKIWEWYLDKFKMNVKMQLANEYFNAHRACALEPYQDGIEPKLRILPYDRFFTYSNSKVDPLKVTHFVKTMGLHEVTKYDKKKSYSCQKMILYVYSDDEFQIMDEDGDLQPEMMAALGVDASNSYGAIPYIYMNRSHVFLNPKADTDLLAMTILIPILITDVNYALKYMAFSVMYSIDMDVETIKINPNAWLNLKSDVVDGAVTKPEVGQIKPQVDSDKAFNAIREQLALWLQSRNIRPGSTGRLEVNSDVSGISKMVDEMDTTNERRKQVPYFKDAEVSFFDLMAHKIHPVWLRTQGYEQKAPFTQDCSMKIYFPEQVVEKSEMELIEEIERKQKMKMITQADAYSELNPDLTEEQVAEDLAEINAENTVVVNEPSQGNNDNQTPEV